MSYTNLYSCESTDVESGGMTRRGQLYRMSSEEERSGASSLIGHGRKGRYRVRWKGQVDVSIRGSVGYDQTREGAWARKAKMNQHESGGKRGAIEREFWSH